MTTLPLSDSKSHAYCDGVSETGNLHAKLATSLPTLHCAVPLNHDAYAHVPFTIDHNHATFVPFPQSIVIGVVVVLVVPLHV